MAKVNKLITLRKALVRGIQYAAVAVAALQTVTVPPDVGVGKQATVVFIIGALGAISKGIHNYRKVSARPVRYTSASGYLLALVGLAVALSGCVTTTAPDGTVTQSVDHVALETAWSALERLQDRREVLESAPATPAVTVEIGEVDREIAEARTRLEALGVVIPGPR